LLRALRWAAITAAVLTYALIVLGATVRATNSGLSCPDWPTCYGHWVPLPSDIAAQPDIGYTYGQVMLEWVHRLIAGVLLGPLVLFIAALAFAVRRSDPKLPLIGAALVLLLLVQGGLGAFTVFDSNSPWSVAVHLGTALLVLTTLLLIVERTAPSLREWPGRAIANLTVLAWGLALVAMMSAAMTTKSGAALACATWPDCDGTFLPDVTDPLIRIHVIHRVLAAATAIVLLVLWRRTRREERPVAKLGSTAALLVLAQIVLGALVIIWQVPLVTAVLHQALGVLVFVTVTRLMWIANRTPTARKDASYAYALRGA
jgi:cytochrome c oxidase assembly protein subunit 15